jgi:hypothetical protein
MNIFNSPRLTKRRSGLDLLSQITKDKSKSFIIHYSCESFVTNHGRTPRVTSICIVNLMTSQTNSFSIHLQAQFVNLDFDNLTQSQYDMVELAMLTEFTDFVREHPTAKWVHWNMRDSNYGFLAINNRLRILNGQPYVIPDDLKFDYPRILQLLYTDDYELNRPKGRLLNLAERNKISTINAMTGQEEADAFDNKEYLRLHMSTLRKVDIIQVIINKTESDELLVNSSKAKIYGLTFTGIIILVKETPWLLLVVTAIGYGLNLLVEHLVDVYIK